MPPLTPVNDSTAFSKNNVLYKVDIGIGPTNWSDGGIASGAERIPGSPKDNSSFSFRNNVVVVESGAMFEATTSNGYRHMDFDSNVYWDLSRVAEVTFPCNPDAHADWLSAPSCLATDSSSRQSIMSHNGLVRVGFNSSGSFVLQFTLHGRTDTLWVAPLSLPPSGVNYSSNQACLQHDAQLCVFERGPPEHILWCVEKNSAPAGPYWAGIGDDCSFCAWGGSPTGSGPHPPFEDAVWCTTKGPCPAHDEDSPISGREKASAMGFPTDCSLASWQKMGFDRHSIVADPMIADPQGGDWRLLAGSPALKRGFAQLNISTAGPRILT